jgi:hypothetical protein
MTMMGTPRRQVNEVDDTVQRRLEPILSNPSPSSGMRRGGDEARQTEEAGSREDDLEKRG